MERRKLILLVEDNPDDENLTRRALQKNDVMNEVVVACSGIEALALFDQRFKFDAGSDGEIPDLIVLDLTLKGGDGIEVLRELRGMKHLQAVPIVVLTGSTDPTKIDSCYRHGANSYVVKSTNAEEFSDAVMSIAMYWLLLNRTPY